MTRPETAMAAATGKLISMDRSDRMPDYVEDHADMMEPAYILFEENGSGAFAFGCVTGQIFGGADADSVEFSWQGYDEMDEARGDGWVELQPDAALDGAICFHGGHEAKFIARTVDFFNSLLEGVFELMVCQL